ncbi:MAG TPA: elongation factor G [Atribacteraceae bacterium]|nr:elongation factor G [Atribacteraceae bacterium]
MKKHEGRSIRNIGFFSHAGAGKTTLSESMLFNAGVTTRRGKVEEGNTVSDWEPEEIKRRLSIDLSVIPFEWKDRKVNLIDTPGYADFIGNVMGALRAIDGGALLVCAVSGVEVGTERSWKSLQEKNLPVVIFINKIDREGANYEKVLKSLQEKLSERITPLFLPIGKESDFRGIINLLTQKAYYFEKEGKGVREEAVPDEMKEAVAEFREAMLENIAETSDELLNMYLEGKTIEPTLLEKSLKEAIRQRKVFPVLCGSGLLNFGVTLFMDFMADYLPSPEDMPPVSGINPKTNVPAERVPAREAPFSAQVFKIISDPYVGKLAIIRVYSGLLSADARLYNATRDSEEKIGQLISLRGKNQEIISEVGAGDIAALAKISGIYTGDSLSDKNDPIVFPVIEFPEPNYLAAVKPLSRGDEDKISQALGRLLEEDFTIKMERNTDTKEEIVAGLGDIHLDVLAEKMKRKFGVDVSLTVPRVSYKETIKGSTKTEGKYKRQSGGRGQYGHCWIELEPIARSEGFEFVDKIVGGSIPRNYIPSVEKGILEAMQEGILAGYPVTDVRVTVFDGSFHPVDSSDMAFKIAGSMAFKKASQDANPVLLEPIVNCEVRVPEDFMGDVIGDLNSRRGKILGMDPEDGVQIIRAQVPMAEVFRYSVDLRSITQGRASFIMRFSHYEEIPAQIAEGIITKAQREKAQE